MPLALNNKEVTLIMGEAKSLIVIENLYPTLLNCSVLIVFSSLPSHYFKVLFDLMAVLPLAINIKWLCSSLI